MLPPPGKTPLPILKHFISLANREPEIAKDENRNHLLLGLYQKGVVMAGRERELKWKATKTSGGGDPSPSYNLPRDFNIFCFNQKYIYNSTVNLL